MTNYYNKDLYKILEINYDATEEDIKHAYRTLVRKYHPDVAKNVDSLIFKEIQEAYEILSNEESRKKYDVLHRFYKEKIKNEFQKKSEKSKYDEFMKKRKQPQNQESFSKSINEALDSLFHSKKQEFKSKEDNIIINGEDINLDITLSCFEAANGTNRKVNILHTQPCPNCKGRKFINGAECSMCKGTGVISLQKKINVKIPKGVMQGSKIRVKKEGNKGLNGGRDGDLFLIVKIEKNPYFDTEGMNILVNLPITPCEAVLGCEIPINITDEVIRVKIPPLTSSGQKLKLAGMGIFNKSKTKRGDMIITIYIKLPASLSEREKELYTELSKYPDKNIRKDFNNAK